MHGRTALRNALTIGLAMGFASSLGGAETGWWWFAPLLSVVAVLVVNGDWIWRKGR